MKEALFYSKLGGGNVRCSLCPRLCTIVPGKTGFCGVRQNSGGTLYSLVYNRACSLVIDPIEKKPLYHFAPGSLCLSICTVGCNLDCSFCQNWQISHPKEITGDNIPPQRVIEIAKKQGVEGIAYTYTEPTIFFEYALDIMKLAKRAGLYNVWVSNGFTNPEPVMEASRYLDAINIDIKGSESLYRNLCNAPGERPVKEAAKLYKEQGVWVEITTLLIPGYNDSDRVLSSISRWVRKNLGPGTPIHFSRFYPHFRLTDIEPTPKTTLEKAHRIAREAGLEYVYIGNVPGHEQESTHCPECGSILIKRTGFGISSIKDVCVCGHKLHIAGKRWSRLK
ncbi:MAG: AmmeMemoRadiSam system radical SAM enzyme [Candidatus Aenigmatarchaeota archaeon]|nr:MAG: AmmeMemoRadiSam system radical SAM enzyme [Candidatus Aenigmarchaeota archaeon]